MKISTKPMSSPSRAEKFPPPLLRFLRSKAGSKSNERLRSSPMFVKNKTAVIETQEEPSSPKVTCIGQVRVRRSSKQSGSNSGSRRGRRTPARGPCSRRWVRKKTLLCHRFAKQLRPRSFRPLWCKCVRFFQFGCCRTREDSSKMESDKHKNSEPEDGDKDVGEEEDEAQAEVASTEAFAAPSPPKNAFLLTRCRSLPYRSSSLASIFWGSPLTTTPQTDHDNEENRASPHQQTDGEPDCRGSTLNPKMDGESKGNPAVSRECEASINGRIKELLSVEALETVEGTGRARPPLLTRCKSEPARTAARLIPEASFWRQPRLD